MKKITYGKTTYNQPENHYESSQTRLIEMNKYVFTAEWGCTPGDFVKNYEGFVQGFNNSKIADCFEFMLNLKRNAMNIDMGFDPAEYLHALILFTDEELKSKGAYDWVQSTYLEEKIKNIREGGVTPKQIAEVVHFFFLNSYQYFKSGSLKVFQYLSQYLMSYYELEKITEALNATMKSQKESKS